MGRASGYVGRASGHVGRASGYVGRASGRTCAFAFPDDGDLFTLAPSGSFHLALG